MKKIVSTIVLGLVSLLAMAQDVTVVDANASPRPISGSFSKIKVSNAMKVVLTQGNTESVVVSASEEKYKADIITEVKNNTLHIYSDNNGMWVNKTNRKLKVYVSFKQLEAITVSGASDVAVADAIKQQSLRVEVSGASTLKTAVDLNTLAIDMSGASKLAISGKAEALNIDCSGASDLQGYKLEATTAKIDVSGASSLQLTVNKEISAEASGASKINYKGSATVTNLKASGVSKISKVD
jgi:hypothetical protein